MQTRTKKITMLAVLCALAYILMLIGRVPVVLFLSYDPKDVVIAIGGFLFGPMSAFIISAAVSLVEMVTVSKTGYIGLIMNIISTCSFACTASAIYKAKRTLKGAVAGLAAGWIAMTVVMLLWNYIMIPLYMNTTREQVAGMLLPYFLPFNLLKGGLNAAFTMLLYKPITQALRKAGMLPSEGNGEGGKAKINIGSIIASLFIIGSCVLLILILQKKI